MKITNSVVILLSSLLSLLILYVMVVVTDSWLLRLSWLCVLTLIGMTVWSLPKKAGETPVK
jgi:hypothetical protein